jgi:aryl-alcohol dehydrogenase-like predicted oxidoreductase
VSSLAIERGKDAEETNVSEHSRGRRQVLKAAATLMAAAGASGISAAGAATAGAKTISLDGAIPAVEFGKTGHRLPILACGGSAFVKKWEGGSGPVGSMQSRIEMVRQAYDAGMRYFDTARNYGESEEIVGKAVADVRSNVYLVTKVGIKGSDDGFIDPKEVRANVERSLELLQTDHVDCLQIHGPSFEYLGYDHGMRLYEEAAKLRDEKLTRFIGLTGHNAFETMYKMIDTGLFDQLLVAYGYFPKGMDTLLSHANLQWREQCLNRSRELGMGVLAMKVMGSYLLGFHARNIVPSFSEAQAAALRRAALRWAINDDRISTLLVGITRPSDIEQNVATLRSELELTAEDQRLLAEFATRAFEAESVKSMRIT